MTAAPALSRGVVLPSQTAISAQNVPDPGALQVWVGVETLRQTNRRSKEAVFYRAVAAAARGGESAGLASGRGTLQVGIASIEFKC